MSRLLLPPYPQFPAEVDGAPRTNGKPRPGQTVTGSDVGFAGGIFLQAFGCAGLWWDGDRFTAPPRGSHATWELMDLHPTLTLVRSLVSAPILASSWNYLKRDDAVPDEWLAFVKAQCEPLRRRTVRESLRALSHGFTPFEKVWEVRDGRYWLADLVAYTPEHFQICRYKRTGKFAGLTLGSPSDRLREDKSWIFANDVRGQNLYGLSQNEAAYDAWCDWNRTRIDAAKLRAKLSGILPILKYPPGSSLLEGVATDNAVVAAKMLAKLGLGQGTYLPNLAYQQEDVIANPDLAKVSLWELDFYDAGTYAPAMAGMIEEREYEDKLLCRALRRPERSALEATKSGSRADSTSQQDNAVLDIECVDDEIADQFSHGPDGTGGVVDDILAINFGADARGAVYVEGQPIVDKRLAVFQKLLEQFNTDPQIRAQHANASDRKAMLETLGVPVRKDAKFEPVEATVPVPPAPPGERPPPAGGNKP